MNDIQKAMAFLREERERRIESMPEEPERRSAPPPSAPVTASGRFDDDLFFDDLLDVGNEDFGSVDEPLAREPVVDAPETAPKTSSRTASKPFNDIARDAGAGDDVAGEEAGRVVALPLERLAAEGFITPGIAKGRLSEEFRRVKRPVLRAIADSAATGGHRNVVMITSSVTGEGKTYTAVNLAMSLAMERERTVLLVDADVLKGSAGRVLGVERDRPGLTDVLSDERIDIADVMLVTDVPDLRFVPAGRRDEQTTELLSSPRMRELIAELSRRYSDRIIVLDCPPMLETNEANVIAEHAGQVIFVVAGEETDQRLVLEATRRFDEDQSVGVLLNKASGNGATYDYVYG